MLTRVAPVTYQAGEFGIAGDADEPSDDQLRRAAEQGSACRVSDRKPAGPHRWRKKLGHGQTSKVSYKINRRRLLKHVAVGDDDLQITDDDPGPRS